MQSKIDAYLGRLVYGNLCSFSFNYEGRRRLRKLRGRSRFGPTASEFVQKMNDDGYYVWSQALPLPIMKQVMAEYRRAISDPGRAREVQSESARISGFPCFCRSVSSDSVPELMHLITPEVRELIHAFFGGPPHIFDACARRTEYIPPNIASEHDVYSNFWHCDNEPCDRFKMFVALSDIDSTCGPLHLLSRPSTRRILRRGFGSRHSYGVSIDQIEDPDFLVRFEGAAGSVMFVNVTQCLHRAGIPAEGRYRDIAEFQFRAPA